MYLEISMMVAYTSHTCLPLSSPSVPVRLLVSGYQKHKAPQLCKGCNTHCPLSTNASAHLLALPLRALNAMPDENTAWAAQYNTCLLIKLMPKGVEFSIHVFSSLRAPKAADVALQSHVDTVKMPQVLPNLRGAASCACSCHLPGGLADLC